MKQKMKRIPVGLLGCTGIVGQRFIELLDGHPLFELKEVVASEKSVGKRVGKATKWMVGGEVPESAAGLKIKGMDSPIKSRLVFSALPAPVAREIEPRLAAEGKIVLSNAGAMRNEPDVPVLIPEVNPEHLKLLAVQRKKGGQKGAIITNPNCTTTMLAIVLKALEGLGLSEVIVTTFQAISGAGVGLSSISIQDNVIPYIENEEKKVENETKKILGKFDGRKITPAKIKVLASCNRVPVIDGHLEIAYIRTKKKVDLGNVKRLLGNFRGIPQRLRLPSAPSQPIIVVDEDDRPQPRLDRMAGNGMAVTVGRIRRGMDDKSIVLALLGHNTIRGAAGGSILNAELLVKEGLI